MADLASTPNPLPYHVALANYLETAEAESWSWFTTAQANPEYADELRLELLKETYRLDAIAYPELFAALGDAQATLTPDLPITLYQSQRSRGLNASVFCLPGEAHIVFEGGVLGLLNPAELRAVLGHELAHYRLWQLNDGRFFLTDRIAQAMAAEPRATPSHVESARLLRLYTEIYADRGALCVTGDIAPVVSSLVKMSTGLTQVDPAAYGRQADEIFARAKVRTEGVSHPESFIRARAIRLWSEDTTSADIDVKRMIEGTVSLDRLDLIDQARLTDWSRRWLQLFLRAPWFRTDAVLGHARLFFPDFQFAPEAHADDALLAELADAPVGIRDYFCYLLLDFAAVDPELEDEPLRIAHVLAQRLDWDNRLEALSVKDLKLKKRDAKKIHEEALAASGPRTEEAS